MDTTPDGRGYWLAASDGGIFAFGDAGFYGSTGGSRINAPITGIQASPTGEGYWLVGQDGGIFAFGDAQYYGSAGNLDLQSPAVAITSARSRTRTPIWRPDRPTGSASRFLGRRGWGFRIRTTRAGTPTATHHAGTSW